MPSNPRSFGGSEGYDGPKWWDQIQKYVDKPGSGRSATNRSFEESSGFMGSQNSRGNYADINEKTGIRPFGSRRHAIKTDFEEQSNASENSWKQDADGSRHKTPHNLTESIPVSNDVAPPGTAFGSSRSGNDFNSAFQERNFGQRSFFRASAPTPQIRGGFQQSRVGTEAKPTGSMNSFGGSFARQPYAHRNSIQLFGNQTQPASEWNQGKTQATEAPLVPSTTFGGAFNSYHSKGSNLADSRNSSHDFGRIVTNKDWEEGPTDDKIAMENFSLRVSSTGKADLMAQELSEHVNSRPERFNTGKPYSSGTLPSKRAPLHSVSTKTSEPVDDSVFVRLKESSFARFMQPFEFAVREEKKEYLTKVFGLVVLQEDWGSLFATAFNCSQSYGMIKISSEVELELGSWYWISVCHTDSIADCGIFKASQVKEKRAIGSCCFTVVPHIIKKSNAVYTTTYATVDQFEQNRLMMRNDVLGKFYGDRKLIDDLGSHPFLDDLIIVEVAPGIIDDNYQWVVQGIYPDARPFDVNRFKSEFMKSILEK